MDRIQKTGPRRGRFPGGNFRAASPPSPRVGSKKALTIMGARTDPMDGKREGRGAAKGKARKGRGAGPKDVGATRLGGGGMGKKKPEQRGGRTFGREKKGRQTGPRYYGAFSGFRQPANVYHISPNNFCRAALRIRPGCGFRPDHQGAAGPIPGLKALDSEGSSEKKLDRASRFFNAAGEKKKKNGVQEIFDAVFSGRKFVGSGRISGGGGGRGMV